jgi:hypothetical protein
MLPLLLAVAIAGDAERNLFRVPFAAGGVICSIPIQTADRGAIFPTSGMEGAGNCGSGFQQLVM